MIYRQATIEDAQAIAQVHVTGWQFAYRGILDDAVLRSLDVQQRARYWQQQLVDGGVELVVAVDSNEVCGFCACSAPRDPNESPQAWELRSIYVLPSHHRKGIGTSLFELALESGRRHRAGTMILWVAQENRSARDFYASRGMRSDGVSHTHAVGDGAFLRRVKYTLPLV